MPGLINRDFADIKTVMSEMGKAMMGTGEMDGDNRALRAAEAAISNPLLDEVSMKGARAVLINVTGGPDLMLFEVDEAVNRIRAEVDADSNILFGSALSDTMEGRVRVSVVATGIDAEAASDGLDNIEHLWPNRSKAALSIETASQPETDFAETNLAENAVAAGNPVHEQVERLAQGLAAESDPLEAAIIGAPSLEIETEPMMLGGDNAPELAEFGGSQSTMADESDKQSLGEAVAKPQPAPRGFARLFGRRRKAEPVAEAKRDPVVQANEVRPEPVASAQTIGVHVRTTSFAAQPAASQVLVTRQETQAPALTPTQEHQSASHSETDLFGESHEDRGADIPAFLRAQDKDSEQDSSERFEIPAFLRRQAGSGS
jgi:cell division protein FtsZ